MPPPSPSPTTPGDTLPDERSCQLLGPTALVVQGILGVLVILSLVYKRHREPHKRPWRIWLFDVSKQVVGQMFVHGTNVLLSDLVSQYTSGNACVFYFLHILLDTTLGVAFIYVILRALTHLFSEKFQLKGFESGVYGTPPAFKYWARQAAVYVLSLSTMKLLVILILILFPGIFQVGKWLLSWTRIGDGDTVQVIFTMGVFPIIMNILQFWLIDSIVKASTVPSVSFEDDLSDTHSNHDREPLFRAPSDDDDDDSYRPHDVENPRSPRRQDHDKPATGASTPAEEHKSSAASTSDEPAEHCYPPSLTSSTSSQHTASTSTSASISAPKPAKNLLKKANRRPAPAPLSIRAHSQPAVNSPSVSTTTQEALPHVPLVPVAAPIPKAAAAVGDAWAQSWDDSDDWANRVGEEDWTGRRMEHAKDTLNNAWESNSPIRVS
ncbi:Store-operated calcium entry regulator STIMATE [Hypsizygus marmoreus]|uniref:Store-operated calcium entry regulator STIMATE n=1 Tax=Hypsizygus marmoreus TaxID=39966 RepID=A0A369JFC6_HYPMA|nr:Store-operated calcium entry regulator STIMATE [Hypsizygus marmoreus]